MKKISKSRFAFLKQEVEELSIMGVIDDDQGKKIMANYEPAPGLNFIRVLLIIGSILIGLGILSFIASNWNKIGKISKLSIIWGFMAATFASSYFLEDKYEKTAKAMLYLSCIIYGGGIFLIGQIFNYGGEFTSAFYLWIIGIIPAMLIFKDRIIYLFANIMAFIYVSSSFGDSILIQTALLLAVLYYANRHFDYSKFATFVTNLVSLLLILQLMDYYSVEEPYAQITFFIIGLAFFYIKSPINDSMFNIQGILVSGLSGFSLSFEWPWESIMDDPQKLAIGVGIALMLYMLYLVKQGLVTPLVIICMMILRYYFDTFYDFMPKSMFFLTGGIILIAFGHYFERLRRRQGGEGND